MPAGPRHAARLATAVIFIALALPAGALASGGKKCTASACKVYHEQDANVGGQQPKQQKPATQPSTGSHASGGQPTNVTPSKLQQVLSQAGPDRGPLGRLLQASPRGVARGSTGTVAAPSALGAAFDLGSGPTVLLAILLATAVALAAYGGLRGWHHRRPSA